MSKRSVNRIFLSAAESENKSPNKKMLLEALRKKNMNVDDLWRILYEEKRWDIAESTVRGFFCKDLKKQKLPDNLLPDIEDITGTTLDKRDEFVSKGRIQKRSDNSLPLGVNPTNLSFDELLNIIDVEQQQPADSLANSRKRIVELFGKLDASHFFFATTLTEMPLIFLPSENSDLVHARYTAIQHGAMFCVVVPSRMTLEAYKKKYTFIGIAEYDKIWNGFDNFRQGLIRYLSGPTVRAKNAEEYCDTHLQMLSFEDFPLTPAHWTVSLLGIRKLPRNVSHRILLRAPEKRINALRLFESMPQYGQSVSDYAKSVLKAYQDEYRADSTTKNRTSRCDVKGDRRTWRMTYLSNFLNRLKGEGDLSPIPLEVRTK